MSIINLEDWLMNEVGTGTDTATGNPGGVPTTQPDGFGGPVPQQGGDPNITNPAPQQMNQQPQKQELPDASADPQFPDMPHDLGEKGPDFEAWKKEFLVESSKGDVEKLKDMIKQVRDRDLEPSQRRFVEDNLQVLFLRENANIAKVSKEIRKLLKDEVDHNNPATSIVHHMDSVLNKEIFLNNVFIKLTGMLGMKGDLHRKFIAALIGAVQVSSGATPDDLFYNEEDYSIKISTRFNARFGEIKLGEWALKEDDPERYLQAPELKRLEDGSPEEKDVLRRRVVMEAIAEAFKTRAFVVNVVGTDGTIYTLGWDLASSLKSAYIEGKLVVRTNQDDASEAMITDEGEIVPYMNMKIMYLENTGDTDENGKPEKKEVEFITLKHGQLFLSAPLPVIKKASSSFQGIIFKEIPWQGNPSDLLTLSRCVPNAAEILLKQCN